MSSTSRPASERAPLRPTPAPRSAPPPVVADAPRFATLWACGLYAFVVLVLGWPILTGQFLVNPSSDEYIAGYAFREYGATTLGQTGGFALWNPYLFGGLPFVAAMHGDIFYPVALVLRAAFPTDIAMSLAFVLHTFLCGLFTYLFLRAVGLGFWASLMGGLAYMIGGPIASYPSPGHDGKLYVSAMLPLALLLLTRIVRDGRVWAIGAFAITIGFATLSPHPQMLQYMLLWAGAWALFLALTPQRGVLLERKVAFGRVGLSLAAVLVGMLMGAVQYLPVMQYTAWSPRAGGKGWEHAISYSMPPEELINTYLPQFSGILENYWGRNGIHLHSEYLVAVALVLVGYAFGSSDAERRRFTWFWLGALVVATLWALGGATPFYNLVYVLVPGTKFFRAPSMILYIVGFATAVLAAAGLQRALDGAYRPKYLVGWGIAAAMIVMIALVGGWTNIGTSVVGQERYEIIAANAGSVTLGALRSLAFVLLTLTALVALGRGRLTGRQVGITLTALVALDGWSIARHYWRYMGPADEIYAADPTIAFVKAQREPGRVLSLAIDPQLTAPHDPMLSGDGLMSHRIRQVLGYHGNELGRYQQLYGKEQGYANVANPKFWQLMNVRWLMVSGTESPIPGLERVAGPARNAAGSTVSLFAIPGENPAAWVAPAIAKAPDDAVLATIASPRYADVRSVALFDTSAAVTPTANLQSVPAPLDLAVQVKRYEPGAIDVRLGAPAPRGSALVVSENYFPGWSATADGRPAPIGRANFVLTGVELPEGAREVSLRFTSAPYERGKVITLVAVAVALLATVGGAAFDRRRGARA